MQEKRRIPLIQVLVGMMAKLMVAKFVVVLVMLETFCLLLKRCFLVTRCVGFYYAYMYLNNIFIPALCDSNRADK